jgi:S1-C subfamily serine protease
VRAVIHDSPAESVGVRGEDVIVRFAGTEITNADQFFDTVVANKGRAIEVELVRPTEAKSIKVTVPLRNE